MGKEADFGGLAVPSPGHGVSHKLAQVGWAPRTPLRTLLASESGSVWASQGADLLKRGGGGGGGGVESVNRGGSPSPPAGSSSPRAWEARVGQVSHKIRVFKKAGVVQAIPVAERPVQQLGALFAQEREESRRVEPPHVQRLRDLIGVELASSQRVGMMQVDDHARGSRRPSPRTMEATKPVLAPDESQELRYLFAKDWALQTSDEEDEFWDSGSLCGASMSCREKPRRRSRFYKNEKPSTASHQEPEPEIVEVHVQSPARDGLSDQVPSGDPKSSLGTLLAEEIATSSASPLADPRWSVPAAESSRRVKIASLDDISAPVRPESQSQLDVLIAKILTLRANSVTGNALPLVRSLPGEDDGGCSTSGSGSTQTPTLGEEVTGNGVPDGAATDTAAVSLHAPNNPPSADIRDSPSVSTQEVPTSTSETPDTRPVSHAETRDDGSREAASNPEDAPRVQLGTLLERTWGEHGWLPLCRSRMGSPLPSSSSSTNINCEESSPRETPSGPSPLPSPEPALPPPPSPPPEAEIVTPTETVTLAEVVTLADETLREGDATPARERPAVRVSLLSLLSQDMETDETGLQADVCGRRDEEEDEVVTEELDPMCCVCMFGHKGAAFIPCGHTFCRKCCREVRRSIGSCPLCNQAIVDVLKLY